MRIVRTIAVVQARLGSSRLPGKVLAEINGRPMLWRVVDRARRIPGVDNVVVACPSDDLATISAAMTHHGLSVYGTRAENDVLDRVASAACAQDADVIIRLTGDSPCLDPVIVGELLALYRGLASDSVYAHNLDDEGTASFGTDAEIFSRVMLDAADRLATDPRDREHVTPWIRRHAGTIVWLPVRGEPVKLSVDTAADLEVVRAVYARVGRDVFSWSEATAAVRGVLGAGASV